MIVSKNTYYLTVLRAIATVGVITFHVGNGRDINCDIIVRHIITSIMTWCVPIFFMISGALNLVITKELPLTKIIKKTAHIMMITVLWGWIYSLLSTVLIYGLSSTELLNALLMPLRADMRYSFHLWFLYAIAGIYLVYPILRKWYQNCDSREKAFFVAIFSSFSILIPTIQMLFGKQNEILWDDGFRYFRGFICYPVLGAFLHETAFSNRQVRMIQTLGLLTIILFIVLSFVNREVLDALAGYQALPTAVVSTSVFITAKTMSYNETTTTKKYRLLGFIAENSLAVYLLHVLVIQTLRKTINFSSESGPLLLTLPLITITVLMISLGVGAIGKRLPFVRKILN